MLTVPVLKLSKRLPRHARTHVPPTSNSSKSHTALPAKPTTTNGRKVTPDIPPIKEPKQHHHHHHRHQTQHQHHNHYHHPQHQPPPPQNHKMSLFGLGARQPTSAEKISAVENELKVIAEMHTR